MEGIDNLGGTCAINSLLQIIIRNDKLRSVILNLNPPENSFTSELKEVIDLIHNQKKSIRPSKFIDIFFKTFQGIFIRNEEIDINELWLFVYNKIFDETSYPSPIPSLKSNDIYIKHDNDIFLHNNKKTSSLTSIVQGSYINVIECSCCKYKSYSFEPFISMSLDLADNETIANLIMKSLLYETREADDWKCDKCLQKCSYLKMKRLWKLPPVLFISLNRFKDMYHKDNTNIYINDNIKFNIGSVETLDKDCIYSLQSLGFHYGNLSGGHYTALCDMKDETFNFYNDNDIKTFKKADVYLELKENNTAYLIVYELS